MESDSIDLLVTDPPYGYSFMNKDWDKAVIGVDTWKECLRVLKPGAFAFIMSSPRQDVLCKMILNLIDAGFRTDFTSIYWSYASGFPKAADVSKLVDKRQGAEREILGYKKTLNQINIKGGNFGTQDKPIYDNLSITKPATEQAKQLDGAYAGFQPKPALEVILCVMKPLSEKSFTDQALKNGKGITWLDDCRIPYQSENDFEDAKGGDTPSHHRDFIDHHVRDKKQSDSLSLKGRFPANLLVSDDILNDGQKHDRTITAFSDSVPNIKSNNYGNYNNRIKTGLSKLSDYGDKGSYSRYFDLDKWFDTTFPFLITPKASKSEKNMGLITSYMEKKVIWDKEGLEDYTDERSKFPNDRKDQIPIIKPQSVNDGRLTPIDNPFQRGETIKVNYHPTVKPIKLMCYLITLGSRKGDIVLDPFCGSGSTCIAAKMLERDYIGIEINKEYYDIAQARLSQTNN